MRGHDDRDVRMLGVKQLIPLAVSAAMALSLACGGEKAPEEQGIKVGFYGALTGPTATFALSGKNGVSLALDELNRAGGVLGKSIVLLSEDDRGEASEAASAVSKLITRDHVVAIYCASAFGGIPPGAVTVRELSRRLRRLRKLA